MAITDKSIRRITVRTKDRNERTMMDTIFGIGMRRLILDAAKKLEVKNKYQVKGYITNIHGRERPRVEFVFKDLNDSIAKDLEEAIRKSLDDPDFDLLKKAEKEKIEVTLEQDAFEDTDFRDPPDILQDNDIKETAWQLDGARRLFEAQERRRRKAILKRLESCFEGFGESGEEKPFEKLKGMKKGLQNILDENETGHDGCVGIVTELLGIMRDSKMPPLEKDSKIRNTVATLMSEIEKERNELS